MHFTSPLRYPGGKIKLSPFIQTLIENNNLIGCEYLEPYAGGASVALHLLYQNIAENIYLNDISTPIYSFWKSILENNEEFCYRIDRIPISTQTWYEQKQILENQAYHSTFEIGFATFFLNRTNYSGVLSGGMIGGKNQSGKYKIDARLNKPNLIKKIQKIANYIKRIQVSNLDAKDFIQKMILKSSKPKFFYLDPPYYVKGRKLYTNYYNHKDHAEIAYFLAQLEDIKWIVSYDNVEPIQILYRKFKSATYKLRYSAQERYLGNEVLFCSDIVELPVFQ